MINTTVYMKFLQRTNLLGWFSGDAWSNGFKRTIAMIRQWKTEHEKEYAHYKANIMHASYGDYSMFAEIMKLTVTCIPQSVLQDIDTIMTGKKKESLDPELDEFISSLINQEGYLEYSKEELESEEDKSIEDMHFEIVQRKGDESLFHYERIASNLEFYYGLPWDWQCAMRSLVPDASDMERAIMARSLYLKINLYHGDIIRNIENLGKRNSPSVKCMLYFIIFDHGLKTAYNVLVNSLTLEQNLGVFSRTIIPTMKHLVSASIELGHDSKAAWKRTICDEHVSVDLKNEMLSVVNETKGISGRPKTATNIMTLSDLLIGDLPSLLALIKDYRKEYPRAVDLAYLFMSLRQSGRINTAFYKTFHVAMEDFENMKYSVRNPQEIYNNFPMSDEILAKKGTANQKRKGLLVKEWTRKFSVVKESA